MTVRRRWGETERARRAAWRADSAERELSDKERIAHLLWLAGRVVPHHVTLALDSHGLVGPQVDIACGVTEPDVDLWEAGKLYPTWEQLLLLAKLTERRVGYFVRPPWGLCAGATSMRFHRPDVGAADVPILRYPDYVVARRLGMTWVKEWSL